MTLHVLGAPSSAGAYSPGQERAPAALRSAGLLAALGGDVGDDGDVEGFRWRPDRDSPRAQHVETVVAVARAVAQHVERIASDGDRALVLGGDCTVGVGTVAGLRAAHGIAPGVVYIDMHPDLNIPTSTTDGALDWMGMAHMLAVDGCCPPLRDIAATTPLLAPGDVVLLGYDEGPATPHEQATIAQLELRTVPMAALIADPRAAAATALEALPGHDALAVHFDVDVVNFLDAPLSENIERARGATLAGALEALTVVLGDPRVAALTVTELNPDHDDGTAVPRLRDGLAQALSAGR
jgi:arginase